MYQAEEYSLQQDIHVQNTFALFWHNAHCFLTTIKILLAESDTICVELEPGTCTCLRSSHQ